MPLPGGVAGGVLGGAAVNIVINAIDNYSKELERSKRMTEALNRSIKLAAIGIAGVFALAANEAAKFETSTIAFTSMMGSAKDSKQFLGELADFSRRTPFTLPGVEEGAKKLMAYGVEADKIIDILTVLGNISVVAGKEKMPRLILALGQIKSKTVLAGQELRQLTETGVPIIEELAKVTGHTKAEIVGDTKDLRISYEEVLLALQNMTKEGGSIGNVMEKSMGSAEQEVSNFSENIVILGRNLGSVLLPTVKSVVSSLSSLIDKFNDMPEGIRDMLSKGVVATGGVAILTGIGVKASEVASNLRGMTPASPVFVSDVTGGGSSKGGKVLKKTAGLSAAAISGIAAAAVSGIVATDYVAQKAGSSFTDTALALTGNPIGIYKLASAYSDKRQSQISASSKVGLPFRQDPIQNLFSNPEIKEEQNSELRLSVETLEDFNNLLKTNHDSMDVSSFQLQRLAEIQNNLNSMKENETITLEEWSKKQVQLNEITNNLTEADKLELKARLENVEAIKVSTQSLRTMADVFPYGGRARELGLSTKHQIQTSSEFSNVEFNPGTGTWMREGTSNAVPINRHSMVVNNYNTQDNSQETNKQVPA